MISYKLTNNDSVLKFNSEKPDVVTSIPFAPGNRDYQEYQEWLAQGNEPEPADE